MGRYRLADRSAVAEARRLDFVGTIPAYVAFGYGSAWVSNYRSSSVSVAARILESGDGRRPSGPLGIAAGAGAVWVVSFWDWLLSRIDPETREVVRRIEVGAGSACGRRRGRRGVGHEPGRPHRLARRPAHEPRLANDPAGSESAMGSTSRTAACG